MKILFDIAYLGVDKLRFCGINRVAKKIAEEIFARDNCDLRYFVAWALYNVYKSKTGINKYDLISNVKICRPWLAYYLYAFIKKSCNWCDKQWLRKLCYNFGHNFDGFTASGLEWADIMFFPSAFYSIPKKILTRNTSVILAYDLIPILYPESQPSDLVWIIKESLEHNKELAWHVCISENTRQDFYEFGLADPKKTRVIYLAADKHIFYKCPEQNYVREKYGIPEGPYLLTLARMEGHKNLKHAIQCYRQLRLEGCIKDLSLVLAGIKKTKDDLSFYEELKKENIICLDVIEEQDLAPLYSGAFAFLYPSIYEGFGLPALEAMQCGVPVIASNTSSIPEVVGNAGILLDPHDIDGWCQALLKLDKNSGYRQKLIADGLERSKEFSWEKTVDQLIEFFEYIVGQTS